MIPQGHELAQKVVLRVSAVATLIAVPAIFVPRLAISTLVEIFVLEKQSSTPLLVYMMAGGSAVFVVQGVLMLVMSFDIARYQMIIRVVAWGFLICSPLFVWIHMQAKTPMWWMWMDGLGCLVPGLILLWACYTRRFATQVSDDD